jgi:hypothetical protein
MHDRARDAALPDHTRRVFARVRRGLLIIAIGAAAAAAIIAARILLWAIGHPDQPFFREIAKLWS